MIDRSSPAGVRAEHRLESELIVWLTTVTAAGQPQSSPVWFVWNGQTFLIFSQPNAQKLRNIRGNPHVALHLNSDDQGDNIVTLDGRAELETHDIAEDERAAYLRKYGEEIKRLGADNETFLAAYSDSIRVSPHRVRVY